MALAFETTYGTPPASGFRLATCPPVVEYGREIQARAAEELARLPEGSAIGEMLSNYAVMLEQARVCRYGSRASEALQQYSYKLALERHCAQTQTL